MRRFVLFVVLCLISCAGAGTRKTLNSQGAFSKIPLPSGWSQMSPGELAALGSHDRLWNLLVSSTENVTQACRVVTAIGNWELGIVPHLLVICRPPDNIDKHIIKSYACDVRNAIPSEQIVGTPSESLSKGLGYFFDVGIWDEDLFMVLRVETIAIHPPNEAKLVAIHMYDTSGVLSEQVSKTQAWLEEQSHADSGGSTELVCN